MPMIPYLALAKTPHGVISEGDAKADAMFWMASLSKLITSFTALICIDKGLLHLDLPIESLQARQVLENGKLRPALRAPTLRQLLTHTSGLTYSTWNLDIFNYMKENDIPSHATFKLKSLDVPLVNDPGVKFDYGISIDYVGLEIERVTGMRLSEAMQQLIFTPLGIKDITFYPNNEQKTRIIPMHTKTSGTLKQIPYMTPEVQEFNMGGGGLWGTANDYMKILQCVLHKGAPLISEKLFNEAAQNQIGDLFVSFSESVMPNSASNFEPMADIPKKHGLFSIINLKDKPHGRSAMSVSWAGLANCFWWVDFEKKITAVCVAQLFPFGDKQIIEVFDNFEKRLYDNILN